MFSGVAGSVATLLHDSVMVPVDGKTYIESLCNMKWLEAMLYLYV